MAVTSSAMGRSLIADANDSAVDIDCRFFNPEQGDKP
jgi:hypothetical protein